MQSSRQKKNISHRLAGLLIPLILLIFWFVGSTYHLFNSYIIPSPQKVLKAFIRLLSDGVLFVHLGASFWRVFCGVMLSMGLSIFLVLLLFLTPFLVTIMQPILDFIRHIPPLAMISILILMLGIGESPKIAIVAIASFFPMFMNFYNGLRNCDPKLLEVGQVAQMSSLDLFKKIIFPSAIPSILTGINLGLAYGWRSLVGAELVAASRGVGYMIMEARELAQSDIIFVGIITLGIVGALMDQLFLSIVKRLVPYAQSQGAQYELS